VSLTVKVTDAISGRPAAGLPVAVCRETGGEAASQQSRSITNSEGIADCTPGVADRGVYRIIVEFNEYFTSLGMQSFSPRVAMTLRIPDETADCRVAFLISPYSWTAYRES
jgi:5-hydroxyisourate hydrolase